MEPDAGPLVERILFAVRAWESFYNPIILHVDGDELHEELDQDGDGAGVDDAINAALRQLVVDQMPDWLEEGDGLFVWEGFPRRELIKHDELEVVMLRLDRGAKIRRATLEDVKQYMDDVAWWPLREGTPT